MKRSRRRTSRAITAVLLTAIAICTVSVLYRAGRLKLFSDAPAMPQLSVIETASPTVAATQPSAQSASAAQSTPPPIETTTPDDSVVASATPAPVPAITAAPAPATQPVVAQARIPAGSTGWSDLLNGTNASPGAPAAKGGGLVTGNGPLADGRARIAAGELVEARGVLNDALVSGKLNDADQQAARSLIGQISQTLIFSPQAFAADPYVTAYSVRPGDSLARIANSYQTTWQLLSRINRLDPRRLRYGATIKVIRGPFFAVVRKKDFAMDLYLGGMPGSAGSMYVMSVPVGLGRDDSTPTGVWAIEAHAKLKHPTYYPPEGGSPIEADDPANPLGGYWIALTGIEGQAVGRASYGIHGTIDPASIGHQASMGCIRLGASDIAMVFDLLVEGHSKVLVQ